MNNDKLKMIKQELRIAGKDILTVNIIKPAIFFYSERYDVRTEGAEDRFNKKYINSKAQRSIDCYGLTSAGLVMEALVVDKEYRHDEPWEVIAYTACIEVCTLNPVGKLKKGPDDEKGGFKYGGLL